jgi:hypothetical protein
MKVLSMGDVLIGTAILRNVLTRCLIVNWARHFSNCTGFVHEEKVCLVLWVACGVLNLVAKAKTDLHQASQIRLIVTGLRCYNS